MPGKLTDPMWIALGCVRTWGSPSYMPPDGTWRTYEALERRKLLKWVRVEDGHQHNGYVLTEAGRQALEADRG